MKLTSEQKKLAKKCTTLQKKFAIHLIGARTQQEAYLDAGGTAKGDNAQKATACEMFAQPNVRAFYDSLIESAAMGAVLTKQQAVEKLSKATEVTIFDVCNFTPTNRGKDKDGNDVIENVMSLKSKEEMTPEVAACIKSVCMTVAGPKIEIYDSHGSIKQLSDMLGWNVPRKTQISGPEDGPIETKMTVTFIDKVEDGS